MSFTEFTYQLVQGYDFYWLYQHKNCRLQMGGSDQWGNIVTGTELIRRKSGGEAFAFTAPLIKKADGGKFGKTESGNIWLDAAKTSPYKFYQFWLNVSDADAESYIKIFTFLPKTDIEALVAEHQNAPHLRLLQKKLAQEITTLVHSADDYAFAVKASEILFSEHTADALRALDEKQLLDIMEGVPTYSISQAELQSGIPMVELLAGTGILASKSEARKLLQAGGIGINKEKVADTDALVSTSALLNQKYILVQKGKKNYYLLIAS
jgi:tyrosyl-tRNA synthetase